ncbi:amphi-Trp domain-containing protein [Natronococcus sp. A-GB1]|nr:amphi-Trp domain-containing protein [Natronococcus sp. A-GB1]MDG5758834.1 amphi-Trp domain-containing protein [Natronococcus sp. A-GB1]
MADHLETVASGLRDDGEFDLDMGGTTFQINPPEELTYEVEVEDDMEEEGMMRHLEFELEWPRREPEDKSMSDSFE